MPEPTLRHYRRTGFTWLAYGLLGYFAYLQTIWGPLVPLLRVEFDLNYAMGGLHATAFALGMFAAGLLSDTIAERIGDKRAFWIGSTGMAAGVLLLLTATSVYMTLFSALLMGLFGTLMLILIQAGLANEHGALRATAITEANVIAYIASTLAPLLVSLVVAIGIGWRGALIFPITVWGILRLTNHKRDFPTAEGGSTQSRKTPFPISFWVIWLGLTLSVAAEWVVTFWTADFLIQRLSIETSAATASLAVFTGFGVLGRWIASQLAKRFSEKRLLTGALALAFVGATLFWVSQQTLLSFAGLALLGFGLANAYPLGAATLIRTAPQQANRASARASLGAAVAILVAPQAVGILADSMSITTAFGSVLLLVLAALALTAFSPAQP
ncbi:MAG: MFS transporter [Anaerolineaceae bacterium]|nr:MFS transporter [Anaerolineaceae bacterium]